MRKALTAEILFSKIILLNHSTHSAAGQSTACKSRFYDGYDGSRNSCDVGDQDDQCQSYIKNCHKRHNNLSNFGNSLDTAENNQTDTEGQHKTGNNSCP